MRVFERVDYESPKGVNYNHPTLHLRLHLRERALIACRYDIL
jgi:hypothetical protein